MPVAIGAGLIGVCLQYRKYKHRLNENRTSDEFAYVIGAGRRGLLENNW